MLQTKTLKLIQIYKSQTKTFTKLYNTLHSLKDIHLETFSIVHNGKTYILNKISNQDKSKKKKKI